MMDLDDAWRWYRTAQSQLEVMKRLGAKHWDALPWDGPLGKDDKLKDRESATIVGDSNFCLEHQDDFDIRQEVGRMDHAHVIRIVEDALDGVAHGSVSRVLGLFKGLDPARVEEVNQVRRYRNWVAHGRQTEHPESVDPKAAYRRLRRFLDDLARPAP